MVGAYLDCRTNQHCHTQLTPVPKGSTVDYLCDQMAHGQVVSINKTSPPGAYMDFSDIRELEVFGFEPGKDAYPSINIEGINY